MLKFVGENDEWIIKKWLIIRQGIVFDKSKQK